MCDVTHNKPFCLGSTAVNEICKRIFCILDQKIFYQWLNNIVYVVEIPYPGSFANYGKFA